MFELKNLPAALRTPAKKTNNIIRWSRSEDFDYISTSYFVMRIHLPNYPAAVKNALLSKLEAIPNNGQGISYLNGEVTNMSQEAIEEHRKFFAYNTSIAIKTGLFAEINKFLMAGIFNTTEGRLYVDKRFMDLVRWNDDLKISRTAIGIRVEDGVGNILLAAPLNLNEETTIIHDIYLK